MHLYLCSTNITIAHHMLEFTYYGKFLQFNNNIVIPSCKKSVYMACILLAIRNSAPSNDNAVLDKILLVSVTLQWMKTYQQRSIFLYYELSNMYAGEC